MERQDENAWLVSENAIWIVVSCKEYYDGEFRDTLYFPLKFENPIVQSDGTLGYCWEDGSHATFSSGDSFPTDDVLEDYIVTKIE